MPPRLEARSPGCLAAIAAYFAICAYLFWRSQWWLWAVLALPSAVALATVIAREVRGFLLLAECRRVLEPRGVRFVVVYSESPTWEGRIRSGWLPRFGQSAVVLNWTVRAQWRPSLEVRLFNHFIKSERNFNPAVLVLRGFERPLVFRFYYAFQQAKGGRPEYLNELEQELFEQTSKSVDAV